MRPSSLAALGCVAFALACGAPSNSGDGGPSREPLAGEGTTCSPPPTAGAPAEESCPTGLLCASWTPYTAGFGVCRLACGQGCPTGESCGADGTCKCQPAASRGGSGDSCKAIGLICHPDFNVCLAPAKPSDCASPLSYAALWTLCLPN